MDIKALGLHDIYTFHYVPFWQTAWFFYTLSVLAVVCVASVVVFLVRSYYKKTNKILTPQEKALQVLASLREHNMIHSDTSAACYHALTTVLKDYLHAVHALPLADKTDDEMNHFITLPEHEKEFAPLAPIFVHGMRAKFAHERIASEVLEADYESVKLFIMSTPVQAHNQKQ